MIKPITSINNYTYAAFRSSSADSAKNSENIDLKAPVNTNPQKQESEDKKNMTMSDYFEFQKKNAETQNDILRGSMLATVFIGVALLANSVFGKSKGNSKDKVKTFVMREFQSLKDNKAIPTLDECKSLDKTLKEFLEKRIMYANASGEIRERVGKPIDDNRILLYGNPGVGKSFFAQIYAKTLGAEYMEIKFADFNSRYSGEDIENMQYIFETILSKATSEPNKKFVVTFNEIDTSIQPLDKLKDFSGSGHLMSKIEERGTIITYMDEIAEKAPNVTIIGTTNQSPKNNGLDSAIISRFNNIMEVDYPVRENIEQALIADLRLMQGGEIFVKANKKSIEELAANMEARASSFRDVNKVLNRAKENYMADMMQDPNAEYKFEYLKKALDSISETDGEMVNHIRREKGDKHEGVRGFFAKIWAFFKGSK